MAYEKRFLHVFTLWLLNITMETMAHLYMVYLLNIVIFHGYVSHNQIVHHVTLTE